MTETFAERLRRLREDKGLSIAALASASGVSEGTVRHLETGKVKSPSFSVGLRLADRLSVDPSYLARGGTDALGERLDDIERRLAKLEQRAPAARR